jgi:quinol monooxygenase YgiN
MTVHNVRSRAAGLGRITLEHSIDHQPGRKRFTHFCESVRASALTQTGCLSFSVRHDRGKENRIELVSEWNSREALNRWVRTSGVLWLERGMFPPIHGNWSIVELRPTSSRVGLPEPVAVRNGRLLGDLR